MPFPTPGACAGRGRTRHGEVAGKVTDLRRADGILSSPLASRALAGLALEQPEDVVRGVHGVPLRSRARRGDVNAPRGDAGLALATAPEPPFRSADAKIDSRTRSIRSVRRRAVRRALHVDARVVMAARRAAALRVVDHKRSRGGRRTKLHPAGQMLIHHHLFQGDEEQNSQKLFTKT